MSQLHHEHHDVLHARLHHGVALAAALDAAAQYVLTLRVGNNRHASPALRLLWISD